MSGKPIDEAVRLLREYREAPKFSNDHDAIKRTVALEDEIDAFLAALTAAQQQGQAKDCHCATCTCHPGMTPAVRFDTTPADKEGAVRDHLIALGWTPPGAQQPASPSGGVNVVGMPEFDGLMDHIYEYGTTAEGVIEKANAFARAVLAQYAPQQPAAVDEGYPTPRNRAEAVALARLALAHLGVIDAHIDAAIARCETNSAAKHQEPKP